MTGSSKKHELKSKQKLEKKLSFYTKVKDAVTTLNAQKTISKKKKQRTRSRQKKLKAYDLSALSELIPETAAPEQKTETKLNCKSRQALVQREAAQLKAVLNNPQFQLDPYAVIHQHLLATQPPVAAKDDAVKHGKDSRDKKRRKKKSVSSSAQSMEM
uniref:Ribosome biogenesis protein slx9-like n=1 Tax=Arundo donax TaxID=35708 RepID=A0A0A9BV73_ARUDO